jgi:uncharacterized protein
MKFSLADDNGGYAINSFSRGEIVINQQRYTSSLILLPDRIIADWKPGRFEEIEGEDFSALLELKPDLVLLGTGESHLFPRPELYSSLIEAGIGLESMTTAAACRTYNILQSEGRGVAAALILD